jgi:hypothetical protein
MVVISTVVMTLRNLGLVFFAVEVSRLAWRLLSRTTERLPSSTSA